MEDSHPSGLSGSGKEIKHAADLINKVTDAIGKNREWNQKQKDALYSKLGEKIAQGGKWSKASFWVDEWNRSLRDERYFIYTTILEDIQSYIRGFDSMNSKRSIF